MPHIRIGLLLAAALVSLSACARYEAMPLTDSAVNERLATPDAGRLEEVATEFHHPYLKPVRVNDPAGLTPDSAALMAVLINPELRAERDQAELAEAQVVQAGILPNPQLSFNEDIVTGGLDQDSVNAYAMGLSWDVEGLLSHEAKVNAARLQQKSVCLTIAWQEWQTAMAAKTAVWDMAALQGQLEEDREVDERLGQNLGAIRTAFDRHDKTILDLSAAEAASEDAHATVLQQEQSLEQQRLLLDRAIGLPPDARPVVRGDLRLPSRLDLPDESTLMGEVDQRLDLLALRRGYESQEETLRAAVIDQFPKINIGFNKARDDTDVKSFGVGISIDIPVFDRNQGNIAVETATRQQLFDEYVQRLFEARSDAATALENIKSLQEQIAADEESIPSDETFVKAYEDAFAHGNTDVLSYYAAVTELAQKRLNVLKLKQQLVENGVALEIATGRYLPAPLVPPTAESPATMPATTEDVK